jgi:hypothetical protein
VVHEPVNVPLDEQLRLLGRWLDLRSARTFELQFVATGAVPSVEITCQDGQGAIQHRTFTPPGFQRMSLLTRSSARARGVDWSTEWSPALRALGQLLQDTGVTPQRIWSEADQFVVSTIGNTPAAEIQYSRGTLQAHGALAELRRQPRKRASA